MLRSVLLALLGSLAACAAPAGDTVDASDTVGERSADRPTGSALRAVTADVVYGHKSGLAMTFDVFEPREPNGAAVIFINTGGWVSPFYEPLADGRRLLTDAELDEGNAVYREFSTRSLLESGFTVFMLRHGASPRFAMSEIVEDLRTGIRFIRSGAGEYGVDPERIGLWGGSAGGHLALLLATTSEIGNPATGGSSDQLELTSGRVAAVVAYFPVTDIESLVAAEPTRAEQFPALELSTEQARSFSPIHFASADDPPALIIHGEEDALIPMLQGESMYEAFLAADVDARFVPVPGAIHGFSDEDADLALAEMLQWFQQHLGRR